MTSYSKTVLIRTLLNVAGEENGLQELMWEIISKVANDENLYNLRLAKPPANNPSLIPSKDEIYTARCEGKLHAIRAYRSRTNAGLKESKDAIEAEMARRGYEFYNYNITY